MNLAKRLTTLEAQHAAHDAHALAEISRLTAALPDGVLEAALSGLEPEALSQARAAVAPLVTPGVRAMAARAQADYEAGKPIEQFTGDELTAIFAVGL